MCSNHWPDPPLSRQRLTTFGVQPEFDLAGKGRFWKSYPALIVRLNGDGGELLLGEFGLLPFWPKERKTKYSTSNARSETVETAASFDKRLRQAEGVSRKSGVSAEAIDPVSDPPTAKDEGNGAQDAQPRPQIVQLQWLPQVEQRKRHENPVGTSEPIGIRVRSPIEVDEVERDAAGDV